MLCKDIVKGQKGYLCASSGGIYACEECKEDTKECNKCVLVPVPKPQQYGYYSIYGQDTQTQQQKGLIDTVMEYVKDKRFLIGLAVGVGIGMFLFKR